MNLVLVFNRSLCFFLFKLINLLLRTLVVEVQSRVCLSMMRQIERCYVAIESSKLAQMFDAASDAELQQVVY